MKNFISKNFSDSNFKNTMSMYAQPTNCNENNKSKTKVKISDLRINTNNLIMSPSNQLVLNNENLSPNSGNTKNSVYGSLNFSNHPTTTKNLILKKSSQLNIIPNPISFNQIGINGSLSTKNSENVLEKKMMKICSINEINKKKSERKLFGNFSNILNKQSEKEEERKANLERVKISHKNFGVIQGYAAITTEGLYRDYNEDRVAIIFNISKPSNFNEAPDNPWPKCSFFGMYDGHGGVGCADFLRDNLHKFIINDSNFPKNPQKAILNGFLKIEKTFLQKCLHIEKTDKGEKITVLDRSGSCAIVVLIVEKRCYIANVGDSRAIMSGNFGEKVYTLSRDHRPNDEKEYKRILEAGGKIYQTEANLSQYFNYNVNSTNLPNGPLSPSGSQGTEKRQASTPHSHANILGPLRVIPGKLSVCRTIGDVEAKDPRLGGNPNVVIGTPEIKYFDITQSNDFIVIGCDGVFEKLKNKEIIENLWKVVNSTNNVKDIHHMNGVLVESLIDDCLNIKSTDNLTAVMISFKNNFYDKENYVNTDYVSHTHQLNKIPKIVKTESNLSKEQYQNAYSSLSQNQILSKIIKSSQTRTNTAQSERFMSLNSFNSVNSDLLEIAPAKKKFSKYAHSLDRIFKANSLEYLQQNIKNPGIKILQAFESITNGKGHNKNLEELPIIPPSNSKFIQSLQNIKQNCLMDKLNKIAHMAEIRKAIPGSIYSEYMTTETKENAQNSNENPDSKITKSKKKALLDTSPCPGKYNPNYDSVFKKIPCVIMTSNSKSLKHNKKDKKKINPESNENVNSSISKLIEKYTKRTLTEEEDDDGNNKHNKHKNDENKALRFSKYCNRKEQVNQSWKLPILSYVDPDNHKEKNKGVDFAKMKERNHMDLLSQSSLSNPSICYYTPKYDFIFKSSPRVLKFNSKENKNVDKNYLIKKMWRSYDVSTDYKLVNLKQ